MYTLETQAHWAAEGAKLTIARLLGAAPAPLADEAKSFAEIYARVDSAITELRGTDPAALDAGLARTIEIRHRGGAMTFRGDAFLTEFGIPNFYFHATAAYCILRNVGVPLTKGDFMGP